MTIKNLYPKSRPQTIYNVINGRPELPAASTFSRASEATYVDANGIIQTAAVDEPRFNHDPETGEFLGLMLEESRTNLKTWSTDYTKTSNNEGYYGVSNGITTVVALNAGIAPDGTMTASKVGKTDLSQTSYVYSRNVINQNNIYTTGSVFVKADTYKYFKFQYINTSGRGYALSLNMETDEVFFDENPRSDYTDGSYKVTKYPGGWYRVSVTMKQIDANAPSIAPRLYVSNVWTSEGAQPPTAIGDLFLWGLQVEETYEGSGPNLYIPTEGAAVTTSPDAFSLTSSSNFDGGFSLLLDSETTTDDYFYKIKASGIPIAELNNANGTLDWVVNGESAATNGEYPQVGAIQPGRVRTISSFGAADGTTQQNYLYTEGLSFPTNAIVASGADEVEFGPGQTLKAAYLWNGQLSNTEAVSVIKGEYNIVPNDPIKADSYSFVYNTDPTTVGETTITLPYIVPTVSMRVYWGDGSNNAYEQGVTPSHTYPYPGQYRIQIEADDGFDAVRLGDVSNTITRVDQWAPQHRVGATGDGFANEDLYKILTTQVKCALIPPFKYTGLTTLNQAFYNCQNAAVNNWDWIPTNLQSVTNLNSAFRTVSRLTMSAAERGTFPQLQTGTALTSVAECFRFNSFTQFDQGNSGLPFSNTQNVTNWSGCFRQLTSLTAIGSLVTSAATTLSSTFNGCSNLALMPFIATNDVTDFSSTWEDCSSLTSFPLIDTSSGIDFTSAWEGCSNLTSFPSLDFSNATSLADTFAESGLTSIPSVTMPSVPFTATGMFDACSSLNGGSNLDFSNCTFARAAFRNCDLSAGMPPIDAPNNTDLYQTYRGTNFTAVVAMDTSSVEAISATFQYNSGLNDVSELANWDLSSCISFDNAFDICSSLANFPANVFDTTGVLQSTAFFKAFYGCALTAQSIENILVSLDTNGQSNVELSIDGGTNAGQSTWTAAANTAYTNLINKGWTIISNP